MPQFLSLDRVGGFGGTTGQSGTRWASPLVAMWLAACAQSPQAAVFDPPAAAPSAVVAAPSECQAGASTRTALERAAQELRMQGMALEARCAAGGGGWVVNVRVVDGIKASKVVRGPLADGMELDMGTPPGVNLAGAETTASGFSPDVQYNREWLRATMARHQFDNAARAWWLYARRSGGAPPSADTDLAAR